MPEESLAVVVKKVNELRGRIQSFGESTSSHASLSVDFDAGQQSKFEKWYEHYDFSLEGKRFCSFCGKEASEVSKMFSGPQDGLFICSGCVAMCHEIVTRGD